MSDARLETARRAHRAGRSEEAARLLTDLLHADSRNREALQLLGEIYLADRRFELAERLLGEAIKVGPSPELLCARGRALQALGRDPEALSLFDAALASDATYIEAVRLRANSFFQVRAFPAAAAAYEIYLAQSPDSPEAWHNLGVALSEMNRYADAIPCFDKAVDLAPGNPAGWRNRGTALMNLERFDEAAADLEKALALYPALPYARGYLMLARLQACDWRRFDEERAAIAADIRAGQPAIPPFGNIMISRDAADQAQCAAAWLAGVVGERERVPVWRGSVYRHDRLRIAYVSGDFREHPVAILMAGVLEHHDRNRFDVTAVSFGPDDERPMRKRITAGAETFVDMRGRTDVDIAAFLREREIDIAVDLMGLTRDCRPAIFSHRAAPVQVNFLGYPGTLAAEWMDYIIADRVVIPEAEVRHYRERIVRLPGSYLPADDARVIGRPPTREEAGLPPDAFVFASFNQAVKFQPDMFGAWMRILSATPGSVLWLPDGNPALRRNLGHEAKLRGIDPARLVFAPQVELNSDHLARLSCADLFLDTLPCNAHSTASDVLWAGVPVLTAVGTTFAGRVAASLLTALGLDDLVTRSPADYEAAASGLAREKGRLAELRATLAANRKRLFDTARYTRHLETAFAIMFERAHRGLAPKSFSVEEG